MSVHISTASAASSTSLLRDGDRWVCFGDSITALNSYPPLLEKVFRHYHPNARIKVINSGVGGDTASDSPEKLSDRVLKHNPNVVSIMYGMNEVINSGSLILTERRFKSAIVSRSLIWFA